jgi:hypothetical protein
VRHRWLNAVLWHAACVLHGTQVYFNAGDATMHLTTLTISRKK